MDTVERASVAIVVSREQVLGIAVSNFGSPLELGEMLRRDYTDRLKIWSLVQMGNMVSVGTELGQRVDLSKFDRTMENDDFRALVNRQCIARMRDRGEEPRQNRPVEYGSSMEWEWANAERHRYLYDPQYQGGGWLYAGPRECRRAGPKRPEPLSDLYRSVEREREGTSRY